ncbi:hypothetical protein PIB30_044193 [Stylosanthes scabra]|uniref:Uncharacterized protein n=1 Tax=Stylosanthes scabra TaxID=79078 RepID=A0ABU6QF54_9FABA|nr:hypothetical protein [Stylosanthes scabra]
MGGPWMLIGQYIVVKLWNPIFRSGEASLDLLWCGLGLMAYRFVVWKVAMDEVEYEVQYESLHLFKFAGEFTGGRCPRKTTNDNDMLHDSLTGWTDTYSML